MGYFRRAEPFDRRSTNLAAPELPFPATDSGMMAMARRLAARPGTRGARPGGLSADALQIANAADPSEQDRQQAKLRKRIRLHLFRCGDFPSSCPDLPPLFDRRQPIWQVAGLHVVLRVLSTVILAIPADRVDHRFAADHYQPHRLAVVGINRH